MEITAIILAGGKSRRLGRNKAFELIDGKSLIERAIERMETHASQIIMVTSREQMEFFPAGINAELLVDVYPDKGPLGGIYTGLLASRYPRSLVVACDMPFLNDSLLRYMLHLSAGYGLIVPRLNKTVEPLHAIYAKRCLAPIKYLLRQDRLSVLELLALVKVRYLVIDEIKKFDPDYSSFFNINTDLDLAKAVEVIENKQDELATRW